MTVAKNAMYLTRCCRTVWFVRLSIVVNSGTARTMPGMVAESAPRANGVHEMRGEAVDGLRARSVER